MNKLALGILLVLLGIVSAEIYFQDKFEDGLNKWVVSQAKDTYGEWKHTAGDWYASPEEKGLQASQDARHYSISAQFDKKLDTTKDKTLVVQFSVKFQQGIDCGGGYLKLIPDQAITDQKQYSSDTQYGIMFGPDVCGATKRIHLIFTYKGQNLLWKKQPPCETDKLTHVYTAVINSDNTYEVLVDGIKKEEGNLYEDWDFLPPKTIPDPEAKKPADWVDEREIADPEDKKPADWDNEPKFIADPDAKKPEDWDDVEDGTWEAPKINNPAYKGEWKPKMIPNPAYKGEWKAPELPNPAYVEDPEVYRQDNLNYVGIEIWTVKAGTIFDNFLVTDDVLVAKRAADAVLESAKKEKEMFDQIEEEKRKQEEEQRKKAEEEAKKKEAEEKKEETTTETTEAKTETTAEAKDEL